MKGFGCGGILKRRGFPLSVSLAFLFFLTIWHCLALGMAAPNLPPRVILTIVLELKYSLEYQIPLYRDWLD